MAIIKDGIQFTGSLGNMSAYTMKGSDKIILRMKGGASKNKIKRSSTFKLTRQNNTEFSGCAKAASSIRMALMPVRHMADYNFTPVLNALAKHVQLLDNVNKRGERAVLFSQHRYLLDGFHLNRQHTFDSVVRHSLPCDIDRKTGSAVVQLPNLLPRLNLALPWQYPLFRFVAGLGVVADKMYTNGVYKDVTGKKSLYPVSVETDWHPVLQPFTRQRLELNFENMPALDETKTLLLSIGIEMGTPVTNAYITPVKYAGCAKVLRVE